jgi:hypothetical protein
MNGKRGDAMIQLIGLLLCVYLFVKGLELISMQKAGTVAAIVAYIGAAIAIFAAMLFAYAFSQPINEAGAGNVATTPDFGVPDATENSAESAVTALYNKCLRNASSTKDAENCDRLN